MVQISDLSMKWLSAFRMTAKTGSVTAAAQRLGLVPSTVSYQLSCLERAVGAQLLTHHERPMRLTFAGKALQVAVEDAFQSLEQGVFQLSSTDLSQLSQTIRLAAIEDFDADIVPGLARALSDLLPRCRFEFRIRPSHEILTMLANDTAHIGLAAGNGEINPAIEETPLLRDPFLLVVPASAQVTAEQLLSGETVHRFLKYSSGQLMRRRIDAELSRRQLACDGPLEFESTAAILGCVAAGDGWTITTALNYARTSRLHDVIRPMAFPRGAFAREISLFHARLLPAGLAAQVREMIVPLLQAHVLVPTVARAPWLAGQFRIEDPQRSDDDREG